MISSIILSSRGFDDYVYWQTQDRKTLNKINKLIDSAKRTPFEGLGNPKPLRSGFGEFWSRKIDDKNRLIYRVVDGKLEIAQCRGHYDDK